MIGGHGHVKPRPDGMRARCGGPRICSACALELAEKTAIDALASNIQSAISEANHVASDDDGTHIPSNN